MFLIANASGASITISDLGITLGPNQALDLHKIDLLINPDNSNDLKKAQKHGAVKILKRDKKKKIKRETEKIIVKETFDKEDLLKDIKTLLNEEIDKKISPQKNDSLDSNGQMLEMLKMMERMIQDNKNNSNNSLKTIEQESENFDIDMSQLVDIHTKNLNKMSKKVIEGKINGEEEIKGEKISKNVDELSNLL